MRKSSELILALTNTVDEVRRERDRYRDALEEIAACSAWEFGKALRIAEAALGLPAVEGKP